MQSATTRLRRTIRLLLCDRSVVDRDGAGLEISRIIAPHTRTRARHDRRRHLGREAAGAVGEQDLGLAIASGIKKDLPRSGIARRVLEADAKVEVSQWNPGRLAAPADVNHSVLERQALQKSGAGSRCDHFLHAGLELKWTSGNPQQLTQAGAPFPVDD